MQSLLFITPELPYPLQSGGKIKTWYLIKSLCEDYEVTLVCPLKGDDALYLDDFMANTPLKKMYNARVNRPRSATNLLASYLSKQPLNVYRSSSHQLNAMVNHIIFRFDTVLIDHFEAFQFLPEKILRTPIISPKIVYHAHNAYHQMWQRFSEITPNPAYKLICKLEAIRVCHYEKSICQQADIIFAAPNDLDTLAQIGVTNPNTYETLHLGNTRLDLPPLNVHATDDTLCYAGLLSWEPNVQGLLWFINTVWPTLKQRFPQLKLNIAGKNPDTRLINAINHTRGIHLLGFVDDLETLYSHCRASICPLRFGSGIKVKVVTAMARGLPIITTPVGAEGLRVEHGKHLLIADSSNDYIEATSQLLLDDMLWTNLSRQSRHLVEQHYTWDALFKRMKLVLNERGSLSQSIPTKTKPSNNKNHFAKQWA